MRRGEVYGFLGPNGAGKATTLGMLLGLVRPASGSVRVLGAALGDPSMLARVGMPVESPAFCPYLSARDNLRVLARYADVPATPGDEALEVVDLTGPGERPLRDLLAWDAGAPGGRRGAAEGP